MGESVVLMLNARCSVFVDRLRIRLDICWRVFPCCSGVSNRNLNCGTPGCGPWGPGKPRAVGNAVIGGFIYQGLSDTTPENTAGSVVAVCVFLLTGQGG